MDTYLTALKDIVIVLAPIIVAYISYRSNKKTRRDIKLEIEKISKEKEAETNQILEKIRAELESQKQLMSWQNSMPQTNEYTKLIEVKRFGNVSALPALCENIDKIINNNPSLDVLIELKDMLELINLPSEKDELFPHEVPILLSYRMVKGQLQWKIDLLRATIESQEDTHHADA